MKLFSKIAQKSKLVIAGSLTGVILAAGVVIGIAHAPVAYAASCDKVNIIYCGLEGSNASDYISSFQKLYEKNNDNGHQDLQAIFNWAGISDSDAKNMNTSNTKVGTLYRNGDIKVDGTVVASDAWVSARFTEGNGFTKIKDGVWARKTTTSLAADTYKVIVHFNADGTFDAAVMVDCGNAVKATKKTPPKPVLKCVKVTGAQAGAPLKYTFTAEASAENTTIESYTFKYSDGVTNTVKTSATKATDTRTFSDYGKTYSVTVTVKGADGSTTCQASITTPPAPTKPELTCDLLTAAPVQGKDLVYTFTAKATPTKTTITDYVFDFGDGQTKTIKTNAISASSGEHTYAAGDKTYTATVTVNSKDIQNVTSVTCKTTVTPTQPCVPTETQDEDCNEVDQLPEELANSGPGAVVGLFAGTSVLGAGAHYLIRRRTNR